MVRIDAGIVAFQCGRAFKEEVKTGGSLSGGLKGCFGCFAAYMMMRVVSEQFENGMAVGRETSDKDWPGDQAVQQRKADGNDQRILSVCVISRPKHAN